MWPRIENVTHPANRHVPVLTKQVIIVSLKENSKDVYCSKMDYM
jgi:hypothetical protein